VSWRFHPSLHQLRGHPSGIAIHCQARNVLPSALHNQLATTRLDAIERVFAPGSR
jgi:hypothetical protein